MWFQPEIFLLYHVFNWEPPRVEAEVEPWLPVDGDGGDVGAKDSEDIHIVLKKKFFFIVFIQAFIQALKQEVRGSNPGAAPPTLEHTYPWGCGLGGGHST